MAAKIQTNPTLLQILKQGCVVTLPCRVILREESQHLEVIVLDTYDLIGRYPLTTAGLRDALGTVQIYLREAAGFGMH